ncbi:MAG: hypothetical protein AAF961_02240, partial [Planctomycetota bacterium]
MNAKAQAAGESVQRCQRQLEPLQRSRRVLDVELTEYHADVSRSSQKLQEESNDLETIRRRLKQDREHLRGLQKRSAETQGRLGGAKERIAVLEELERRLEGLNAGARDALRRAEEDPNGPFSGVRGVVADLLSVDADTAPLIEIALGERANYLVIDDAVSLIDDLDALQSQWRSRTSFLRLDVAGAANAVDRVDLSRQPGVMGRADTFVETTPDLEPLARRLLGRHWLVDCVDSALNLADGPGRGLNFITLAGEVVSADGALVFGPHQSTSGLLSRRSELAALKQQATDLIEEAQRLDEET